MRLRTKRHLRNIAVLSLMTGICCVMGYIYLHKHYYSTQFRHTKNLQKSLNDAVDTIRSVSPEAVQKLYVENNATREDKEDLKILQQQQQQPEHQHEQQQKQLIQPTNGVKEKSRNCSFWSYPAEVKTFENPRIKLDPTRFIYPGIVWGPNNQVIGMVDSTLFAIKLNR